MVKQGGEMTRHTEYEPRYMDEHELFQPERPGWVPEWVGGDWNPHPYAYQAAGHAAPAGRFHSAYLQTLAELLCPVLEQSGLMLVMDTYLLYRDWENRLQRMAVDVLIAPPADEPDDEQTAYAYNLDTEPLPRCVIELTSVRNQAPAARHKRLHYAALGIGEYMLLDIVDAEGRMRPQIEVSLWRLADELPLPVPADEEGYVTLESIGVRLRAQGQHLEARWQATGELLRTSRELMQALEAAEHASLLADERAAAEAEARSLAETRAAAEAEARAAAEKRATLEERARVAAEARAAAEAEALAEFEEQMAHEREARASAEERVTSAEEHAAHEEQARAAAEARLRSLQNSRTRQQSRVMRKSAGRWHARRPPRRRTVR